MGTVCGAYKRRSGIVCHSGPRVYVCETHLCAAEAMLAGIDPQWKPRNHYRNSGHSEKPRKKLMICKHSHSEKRYVMSGCMCMRHGCSRLLAAEYRCECA